MILCFPPPILMFLPLPIILSSASQAMMMDLMVLSFPPTAPPSGTAAWSSVMGPAKFCRMNKGLCLATQARRRGLCMEACRSGICLVFQACHIASPKTPRRTSLCLRATQACFLAASRTHLRPRAPRSIESPKPRTSSSWRLP